jgi:hypothetical protein
MTLRTKVMLRNVPDVFFRVYCSLLHSTYLYKVVNSSVVLITILIILYIFCLDMQSCSPAGTLYESVAPTPQRWIQH